jgi:hypothetical protein
VLCWTQKGRKSTHFLFYNNGSYSYHICIRRLLSGLNFESHRCFFNPARVSPSVFLNNKGRLYIKDSRSIAVLVTTGAVASCNLIAPAHGGTTTAPSRVKNISLYPLRQEYVRTASCVGTVLGAKSLYGPVSGGTMTFSTRKDGAATGESVLSVSNWHVVI